MKIYRAGKVSGRNVLAVFLHHSLYQFGVLIAVSASLLCGGSLIASGYTGFESRQVHPVEVNGSRLLAINSPAGLLEVYDLANKNASGEPALERVIPVGLGPVSVRARTGTEAWVVNEVSDSISVVDLANGVVVETIHVPDEPADVVFIGSKALVTCARSNLLRLIDVNTLAEEREIPVLGNYPTSLEKSLDGSVVYVSFLLSGNGTTVLAPDRTAAQSAPTNTNLPLPPDTSSIVAVDDPRVSHHVYDHDLAVIDTATWGVLEYVSGVGTILRSVAIQPGTGDIVVSNMESRNLVSFEPALRGHVVDHRLARVSADLSTVTGFDLNPGIDYSLLPNPTAVSQSLAEPCAIEFETGTHAWITAFGSDRIAKVDVTAGTITDRIDLRGAGEDSRFMRGPRGLAIDAADDTMYVLNKISNSISVINLANAMMTTEFTLAGGNPMHQGAAEGRGFLFDARLSGNGTVSCGVCHIDADRDGLAWDLGDPGGVMTYGSGLNSANHELGEIERPFHPMKGPMVTQTLRNLEGGAPFHWRGDKPALVDFNPTFVNLLGGDLLTAAEFALLEEYLLSLRHHPNPYRNLDNSLPEDLVGGNAQTGEGLFNIHLNHCSVCHEGPRGSLGNIDDPRLTDSRDSVKVPPLQTTYQRFGFDNAPGGASTMGFGMNRDGTGSRLPTVHFYELGQLDQQGRKDVAAFVLSFDTGTPASVGQARTLNVGNRSSASLLADLTLFETQAGDGLIDLVAEGISGSTDVALYFDSVVQKYTDGTTSSHTRAELLAALQAGEAVTFTVILRGQAAVRLNLN